MDVSTLFDPVTSTLTHVVADPATGDAVVLDSVLDFDPTTGRVQLGSVRRVTDLLAARGLTLRALLETHVHADHWSAAAVLRERTGAPVVIGRRVTEVQATFAPRFGRTDLPCDGRAFDHLAADGEVLQFGSLTARAIPTPGHTPACVSWHIGDAVFTGDALLMPDAGVGRCDFPGGSAERLYDALTAGLYTLPDATRVFVGHDYQPGGRPLAFETTIGAQKAHNVHLPASRPRDEFVAARRARDATLAPPRLLYFSLQVNLEAGRLPEPVAGLRSLVQPIEVVEG